MVLNCIPVVRRNFMIGESILRISISNGDSLVELRPEKVFQHVNVDKFILVSHL